MYYLSTSKVIILDGELTKSKLEELKIEESIEEYKILSNMSNMIFDNIFISIISTIKRHRIVIYNHSMPYIYSIKFYSSLLALGNLSIYSLLNCSFDT